MYCRLAGGYVGARDRHRLSPERRWGQADNPAAALNSLGDQLLPPDGTA